MIEPSCIADPDHVDVRWFVHATQLRCGKPDSVCGICQAPNHSRYPFMPPHARERLGIENAAKDFNSGMLLISLARMRIKRLSKEEKYGR